MASRQVGGIRVLQFCLATFFISVSAAITLSGPTINLGYISVVGNATTPNGIKNGSVDFFGGIPYARPPLGQLRFKAPQRLEEKPRNKPPLVDARSWGPPCIQQDPAVVGVGSEDCLLLNVWKPAHAKEGDKLPVIVYIHGGGFYFGTPQGFPMYDWVNQSQNIIAVSMGYRLNMFGFLASPCMEPNDLNAGLQDQRAALDWVQRHISQFGGDPNIVTIAGESAGGAGTIMQIVAYGGTRPLPFNRAISQSIGYGPTPTKELSVEAFNNATLAAGCPSNGKEGLDCLRSASLDALVSAVNHVQPGKFAPIISGAGTILPDFPAELIRTGKFIAVDYVGGHCTNDGRSFTNGSPDTLLTEDQLIAAVVKRWPSLSNSTLEKVLKLYPSPNTLESPFNSEYDRAWVIEQDAVFGCMDLLMANRIAQLSKKNTFTFRFNAPDPVLYAAKPYLGVMHTSDLYFLFDGTNAPNAGFTFKAFNDTEMPLSREIIAYWTSFARSGDPSTFKQSNSPLWSKHRTTGKRLVMTRGETPEGTASNLEDISDYEIERCGFWMSESVTKETML